MSRWGEGQDGFWWRSDRCAAYGGAYIFAWTRGTFQQDWLNPVGWARSPNWRQGVGWNENINAGLDCLEFLEV